MSYLHELKLKNEHHLMIAQARDMKQSFNVELTYGGDIDPVCLKYMKYSQTPNKCV